MTDETAYKVHSFGPDGDARKYVTFPSELFFEFYDYAFTIKGGRDNSFLETWDHQPWFYFEKNKYQADEDWGVEGGRVWSDSLENYLEYQDGSEQYVLQNGYDSLGLDDLKSVVFDLTPELAEVLQYFKEHKSEQKYIRLANELRSLKREYLDDR